MPSFKMLSGYVSYTSPMLGSTHSTFFWLAEASEVDPRTAPIAAWSNGGPGCSGLFGMGFENGPFVASSNGSLAPNPLSWNRRLNMLWFEQPAGVGFSFSSQPSDYQAYDDDIAATDNAAFFSAFFTQFPQYASNPLWFTSESYGGNYIPQLARTILQGSDARLSAQLQKGGFIVGNPVFSIDNVTGTFANIMNLVTPEILVGHSLIPRAFAEAYKAAGCASLTPPSDPCDALTTEMFALAGPCFQTNACSDDLYQDPYGNATLGPAVSPHPDVDAAWGAYLNRADVQAAIHAQPPALPPWSDCANIGYNITWPSNIPDYSAAFAAKLKVLIISGDIDMLTCPFASTEVAVDTLSKLPGAATTANWSAWSAIGQPAGYIEKHGEAFTFATVKAAGHEAPGYQPLASFALVNSFIAGTLDELIDAPAAAVAAPVRASQSSILRAAVAKTRAMQAAA